MRRYILVAVLFLVVLVTGCIENQNESNNKDYEMALSEFEKTIDEKYELEKNLTNAELKIAELKKQISNLEENLSKQNEEKVEKENLPSYEKLRIIAVHEKELKYVLNKINIPAQSVSIVGANIDDYVESYEEIRINGLGDGEYFRAEVIGSIYDFQLVEIAWDDETSKLKEVRTIHELDEVRNQVILIETYLPCGMVSEKIKWRDSEGNMQELILANDGYGFDGSIIWSK